MERAGAGKSRARLVPDTSITEVQATDGVERLMREMTGLRQPEIQFVNREALDPVTVSKCSAGSLTCRATGQVSVLARYETPTALPEATSRSGP